MIIMIIFLVLTVIFVIGTVIYLNNKKKNINAPKHSAETKDENKNNKKGKKQLNDILQIKIKDNIICLGNRYSIVVRLGNIDYNMLSISEQDSIENVLIQTALAIDFPIQFFSTTEFMDTSKVISLIKQNKSSNVRIREYKQYLIDYLQNLMENRTISVVKNYAIISYDGTYDKALEELNRKSLPFTSNLLRAKIVCETLSEDELYNLIYRELNKNSAINVSNLIGVVNMGNYPKEVYNLLHSLYDKKEYDGLMNFNNKELTNIKHQISNLEKELNSFLIKRVYPCTKEKLENLLEKQKDLLYTYFYVESKLIYEDGVTDGINLIVSNFTLKKKDNQRTN